MTTYNKAQLAAFFEQGDVPTGTNYSDLIYSCINVVETAVQTMAGPLNPTEVITPRVSATNVNVTGTMTIAGQTSAQGINCTNVSANVVWSSAQRTSIGIVSAAGTAQATGASLVYTINRGAGVTDGQTTGFLLSNNQAGRIQYIINGGASANLWPASECVINVLATNAAFAMAANTPYTIIHTTNSAYAVK